MRFREFILTEQKASTFVVGDSIALGIQQASGFPGIAVGGKNPTQVLDMVRALIQQYPVKDATVIVSSGASNGFYERPSGEKQNLDMSPIYQQLQTLKDAGAKVVLVGTGSGKTAWFSNRFGTYRLNFEDQKINEKLAQAAAANGAVFLGPLETYDPSLNNSGDGVHPSGAGYQAIASAAAANKNLAKPENPKNKKQQKNQPAGKDALSVPQSRQGEAVKKVQAALIALGYSLPQHGADGVRGPETIAAVKKFQQDHGLQVDGDPGPETVGKLNKLLAANPKLKQKVDKIAATSAKPDKVKKPGSTVGYNASVAGVAQTGSAKEAINFFKSKGWTPAQAAGLVANLQAESGQNLTTNAVGDGGQAYGIAQWHPPRQADFKRAFGKDIREAGFKEQLEFVNWELNNTESKAGSMLRQAKTPEEAAAIVDEYYERSSGAHRDKRIAFAQNLSRVA